MRFSKFVIMILLPISGYSQSTKTLQKNVSLAEMIDQTRPCIVRVEATWTRAGKDLIQSQGTGFIVNSEGIVVTAKHVIDPINGKLPDSIAIYLPVENSDKLSPGVVEAGNFSGTEVTIIDSDSSHDMALLRPNRNPLLGLQSGMAINGVSPKVRKAGLAHMATHTLKDGEPIFVSGYPFTSPVLITTSGSVASSDAFSIDSASNKFNDAYLLDLTINPGNSGGPVFSSLTGEVVGIILQVYVAPVKYGDGDKEEVVLSQAGPNGAIMRNPDGTPHVRPITYNSGIAVAIGARHIANLLAKNHILAGDTGTTHGTK